MACITLAYEFEDGSRVECDMVADSDTPDQLDDLARRARELFKSQLTDVFEVGREQGDGTGTIVYGEPMSLEEMQAWLNQDGSE